VAFVAVGKVSEIPAGRGLRVVVDGVEIGIFRVGEALHAIENACPHAGAPLSEGTQEGPIVTCELHGWRFDVRTGFDPDHADGFPIPCFAVRIRDAHIEVDVERMLNRPPRRSPAG
jgi:nitrite reductase/ring-hydroxylating ferredoxin subunit